MKKELNGVTYRMFWGGIYSNWYPAKFVIDGIEFNNSEQYFMYMKAMTFNNPDIAEKILQTSDPKEQKKLGRLIQNYDDKVWSEVRYEIVKRGVKEKFLQNPILLKELIVDDKGCVFVETSPEDRIWGVGYHENNALNFIANWGQNLLGKLLTELSEELQ